MSSEKPRDDTYHITESGTKWPNCLACHSEETTIIPKTGEWTCQNCGHQWHNDETILDDSDSGTIGDEIETMLRALEDENSSALEQTANEHGIKARTHRFGGD